MPGFLIGGTGATDGPSSTVEAARAHRWEVLLLGVPNDATSEIRSYARSISRPCFEADRITLHHRQNELYLPGKIRAGVCALSVYEHIDSDTNKTASTIRDWWSSWMMEAKKYSLNMDSGNTTGWKRQLHIAELDGCGDQVWGYLLSGVFPLKVEGSPLDYTSTDLSTIDITLSVDAFQEGQDI